MTREEAIDLLDNLIGMVEDNHNSDYDMALKMAIKALNSNRFISLDVYNQVTKERDIAIEQLHELGYELGVSLPDIKYHSHHCVDRRLVEALVYKYLGEATDNHVAFYEELLDLPLVTPIKPRGHWIEEFDDLEGEVRFTCSNCRKYQLFGTDFCYHCGSENREVKE